jgi:anti-sigma regulatory factor (Ser/Thr protein kinase)
VIVRRAFGASEEAVAEARRFASEAVFDLPVEIQDAVLVMVSELSTNALVHASTGFEVTVERSVAGVMVSITDRGDGTPAVRSPGSHEPHGRGLRIVQALSDEWGVISSPETGKTVWFRVSLERTSSGQVGDSERATRESGRVDRANRRESHSVAPLVFPELGSRSTNEPSALLRVPPRRARANSPAGDQLGLFNMFVAFIVSACPPAGHPVPGAPSSALVSNP